MIVFDNNRYCRLSQKDYTTTVLELYGTLVLEIGIDKPIQKRKRKKREVSTTGVKKELLEYHYGIYRMFPCGKQHRYHMQYIHVNGVCERNIR